MSLPGAALAAFLRRHAPGAPQACLCVAFSGGVDSIALLLAALELRAARSQPVPRCEQRSSDDASLSDPTEIMLRAVHVHHGLQADASRWQARCEELCATLEVPLTVLRVDVDVDDPQGIEAAARRARYAAFRRELRVGEWLLTAHQADDQLETVLIQLLRGAGVAGLAAMPAAVPFGPGWLGRPLLGLRRSVLQAVAAAHDLRPAADPMNDDLRFDRAYLRRQVLPALQSRWPAAAVTVSRAAGHCATAQQLLDDLAAIDAREALDGPRLRLAPLALLDHGRRANVLRWWLARAGIERPTAARLDEILRQMWAAPEQAQPVIRWRGGEVRRYRRMLYAMRDPPPAIEGEQVLYPERPVVPAAGLGMLSLSAATGQGLRAACCAAGLAVRPRRGGEAIRLRRGAPRRPLRLLLQEAHIVPWWRSSLPLLWSGTELVAVADRWISADHAAASGEPGYLVLWKDAPALS